MSQTINNKNDLRNAPAWVHGVAWGIFTAITLVLVALYIMYKDTDVWLYLMDSTARTKGPFNELIRPSSIFRAPSNTWSNLGYILIGLYIIVYGVWDLRRETSEQEPYAVRQPWLMILFGIMCVELGFGSGFMHASHTSLGHKADVFGMFSTMSALIAIQWARLIPAIPFTQNRWPSWPIFGIVAVVSSFLLLGYLNVLGGNNIMLGLIVLAALGTGVDRFMGKTTQQIRWPLLAFVSLGLAYYIWRLDKAGQFTAPDHWLQGHAIWHVLTALTLGSMAVFYRSEVPRAGKNIKQKTE